MQSRPDLIGTDEMRGQQKRSYIGFEKFEEEYNHETSMNNAAGNAKSNSTSPRQPTRTSSFQNSPSRSYDDSQFTLQHLCTPMLSSIYSEIVTFWFKVQWLIYDDNVRETFLVLKSNVDGYLPIQTALDQKSFVNSKSRLHNVPECLLIQTEFHSKTTFLPNLFISFDHLLHKNIRLKESSFQGQLIAILCKLNERGSKLMFYKHLQRNTWHIYFNTPEFPSEYYANVLSDDEASQLESIAEENDSGNFNDVRRLEYPLSLLTTHPIIYVYITRKISDAN
ncbi:unnamed protein product [Adineta ricciae]|uniref:Uncharacterized protein n=1 Tax=Adineta ricciae TaxID=249248 RepID=A0A814AUX7_ADIRI|nr:unnamed protein product [Adineta ricciae]CAF1026103.1 unnamed protein product [Adineta ricciae]